jgi:hypothetical protein
MKTKPTMRCKNHPDTKAYTERYPLCEDCLADEGQAIIDAGTHSECLEWWAHENNYSWHQAMVRLGMARQDPERLESLINSADAAYLNDSYDD